MKNSTLTIIIGITIGLVIAAAAGTLWYYKDTIIDYIGNRVTNRVIGGAIGGIATVPLMPLKVFGGGNSNK
jgi:hypothetical protein